MVTIATLCGKGYFGEDVLFNYNWINALSKKHSLIIFSRVDKESHFNKYMRNYFGEKFFNQIIHHYDKLKKVSNFQFIYSSAFFSKKYSDIEIQEAESWLGLSFLHIAKMDRRFYNRTTGQDKRIDSEIVQFCTALTLYFRNEYKQLSIDYLITQVEDDAFSVIPYYVAKKMGIEVITTLSTRFPKKGLILAKDFNLPYFIADEDVKWTEILSLYDSKVISGKEIMQRTASYWDYKSIPKRIKGIFTIYNFICFKKTVIEMIPYEKMIFENVTFLEEIRQYIIKLFRKNFLTFLIDSPSNRDNYFLFSLHYMDDAQITFREPFLNQYNLIYDISRSLPSNYYLYIKPHPHYLGTDISLSSLLQIKKLHNVKIISPIISTIELLSKSTGLFTVNSSTGFEALIFNTPVISFGHDFFCDPNFCKIVYDKNDLPKVINQIINNESKINNDDIHNFVKNIYINTIWINYSDYGDGTRILDEESGNKIANRIDQIVNRIKTVSV